MSCAGHYILRSHWFTVQQCLFGGPPAFSPYVHQSQSHKRWVQHLRPEPAPYCLMCVIWFVFFLSCHSHSSSGFQLPRREKYHQVAHQPTHRGRKKRFFISAPISSCFSLLFPTNINMNSVCPCFLLHSFFWMQVQNLHTQLWSKLLWPPWHQLVPVSSTHPSTGVQFCLLWWGSALVRCFTHLSLKPGRFTEPSSKMLKASFFSDRGGSSASVCGTGSFSGSVFSERCSLSGLLGVTTTRS